MGSYSNEGLYLPGRGEVGWDDELNSFFTRLGEQYTNVKNPGIGAVGDGVTDDSEAVRTAMDAVAGGGNLYFPAGTYRMTLAGRIFPEGYGLGNEFNSLGEGLIAQVPSNVRVFGEPGAVIYMEGVPSEDYLGPLQPDHYTVFGMGGGESNILFDGLTFRGDYDINDGPFFAPDAAPIRVYSNSMVSDVTVRNCRFENICGFSVHGEGYLERVNVIDCTMYEMGNGVNVNADWTIQRGNHFIRSGGTETVGIGANITGNTLEDCTGGISVGGWTAVDTTGHVRGVVVSGNSINGSTTAGINLGDGIRGAAIVGNTITRCDGGAITMTRSTGYRPSDCIFSGNTIFGNNKVSNSNKAAITLGEGGSHIVVGNAIFDEDSDADYWQQVCIAVYDTDDYIAGNYIATTDRFGGSYCIDIESGGSAQIGDNFLGGDTHVNLAGTAQVLMDHGLRSLHANLPAATAYEQGSQYYCMTHKQPLWSDTTNWVEADGTNH